MKRRLNALFGALGCLTVFACTEIDSGNYNRDDYGPQEGGIPYIENIFDLGSDRELHILNEAEKGNISYMINLGEVYSYAHNNRTKGVYWFTKAALHGSEQGVMHLVDMLWDAPEVRKSRDVNRKLPIFRYSPRLSPAGNLDVMEEKGLTGLSTSDGASAYVLALYYAAFTDQRNTAAAMAMRADEMLQIEQTKILKTFIAN